MIRRITEQDWIAHPNREGESTDETATIIANRDRIEVVAEWADPTLEWEFFEIAVIRLDGNYYALTTSGCSCPSPTEVWSIDYGPATLDEMRTWVALGPHADVLCCYLTDEALA